MTKTLKDVTGAILAGGLGTRLRSRISDRPKVLAPVHGRPYLAYLLDQLAEAGIQHAILLTGYLAEQIRDAFGETYGGLRLTYSVESSPLGTAGALGQALPHMHSPSLLLLNGDSYCAAPLADFWETHCRQSADFSLVLTSVDDCSRYGRVSLGLDGRVVRFEEKTQADGAGWVNAGIYLMKRALIEDIPAGSASLEHDMFPRWAVARRCYGFPCPAQFLDIGTPESYAQAEVLFTPPSVNGRP